MHGTLLSDWLLVALSGIGILLIPLVGLIIRATIKWTRTESALQQIVEDFKKLVSSEAQVHAEILEQVRQNREQADRQMDSFDKRLRFMEEYWIKRGIGNGERHLQSHQTIPGQR